LEQAFRKTVAALKHEGRSVYEPALLNRSIHSKAFGRLLLLQDKSPEIVYVTRSAWKEEVLPLVVTDLVQAFKTAKEMNAACLFRILSAHPIPDVVRVMFDNSVVSRLEVDLRSQFMVQDPMPTDEMPVLAERHGLTTLQTLVGKALTIGPGALPRIQEAILKKLRPGKKAAEPLPEDAWAPDALFLCLGAAIGESVARRPNVESTWINHPSCPLSIALALRHAKTGAEFVCNPVGKAKKLYLFGSSEDLETFDALVRQKIGIASR
jgi:hypothetical protein